MAARSAFFWVVSVLHFFPGCGALVAVGLVVHPRRLEPLLRFLCRNVVRCTGARYVVRRTSGFDPKRTCFFVVNHVEIFDPFLIYPALGQRARGVELETHFRVPVYGWLMKRWGNIPVPAVPTRVGLETMRTRAQETIAAGTSLIVFPEGTRTRTGDVGQFKTGLFRLAIELGAPVVPVSLAGAYALKRVGSWRLSPATVVVHVHDPIETKGMTNADARTLAERVRDIIRGSVEREALTRSSSTSAAGS